MTSGGRRSTDRAPGRGFRSAFSALGAPVGRAAGKLGFAQPEVLLRWREVVGAALAGVSRPVRVSYGARGGLGATLTIAADGAHATEISHDAPRIIERVNRFYGYAAVSRIRVTQSGGGAVGFAEPPAPFASDAAPEVRPDAVACREAESLAARIEDPDLRAALAGLGASILSRRTAPGDAD